MDLNILLDIARKSILSSFDSSLKINKEEILLKYKELNELSASFVTLTKQGQLRACIGSLQAYESLYDSVFKNARKAAFSDPRFLSLEKEELEKIKIEVSVLSQAKLLEYKDLEDLREKLIPNKHGVILKHQQKQATFLPQVWEQLPSFEEFISNLCYKANLDVSCFESGAEIFVYEVKKVKE